jgi:hypothetical protein
LKLFDTVNDETNWSQISGALDGVGSVFQMGRSAPCFSLELGHKKWATLLALISVKKSN